MKKNKAVTEQEFVKMSKKDREDVTHIIQDTTQYLILSKILLNII